MATIQGVIARHNDAVTAPSRTTASGRVTSRDGTLIAYDRIGQGPPLILVDGALCSRSLGPMPTVAKLMAREFTVFTYDRRGRGDSGDTQPYAVEREIEDLAALINGAGGAALVFGISSGAVLALTAAARGLRIRRLALYEAPFIVDDSRPTTEREWARIDEQIAAGARGDAVKTFLKAVGAPAIAVNIMRWLPPIWSKVTAVAHTLPYDGAIVREYQQGRPLPADRWASVTIPTLVLDGGKSPAWIRRGVQALADLIPHSRYSTLAGQTHNVAANRVAPTLREFFGERTDGGV